MNRDPFECPICGVAMGGGHRCAPSAIERIEAGRKRYGDGPQARAVDAGKSYDDKLRDAELMMGDT